VVIAIGLMFYILVGAIAGRTAPGWASLGLMVSFFSVGQLFCLAIMGSYLGRVFMQVKGRPLYLVDEIVSSQVAAVSEPMAFAREG